MWNIITQLAMTGEQNMLGVHGCYASAQAIVFYAAPHAVLRYCEKGMLWLPIGSVGLLFAVLGDHDDYWQKSAQCDISHART